MDNKKIDEEIEMKMENSLKKIPWEVRKIKTILWIIKKYKMILKIFHI